MSMKKRVKLIDNSEGRDSDHSMEDDPKLSQPSSDADGSGESDQESSPDTDDEIADAHWKKSKKTLKRKRRATEPSQFGATLQSLLHTEAPSALPLSLKPSVTRQKNDAKLELQAKRVIMVERKEKEDKGRIRDVIGGWGGE
ncbi:hypothetical protein HYDPIDRAFT_24806, partial [Hydnomerulius pinastri MD-312]